MTSAIVRKYARALADVALEQDESEQILADLETFRDLYLDQAELRNILRSPALPLEIKRNVLREILARLGSRDSVRNFLSLLLDRNRLDQIDDLLTAYQAALDQAAGIVPVSVSSTGPLDEAVRRRLRKVMANLLKRKVRLAYETDPELIGGIRIQVGSTVYDGTIRTRLEEIGRQLAVSE